MEKVDEPNVDEVWNCPRCNQDYCGDCVDIYEVGFDIIDKSDGINTQDEQWKDRGVCPWCYNQLIDKKSKEVKNENKQNS